MKILVTGAAGFIGFHVAQSLMKDGHEVIGLDNLNDYYDVTLKQARLGLLEPESAFSFYHTDITDKAALEEIVRNEKPQRVIHLAAQAGVRYSLINPYAYIDSNITGFLNILEACRTFNVEHLIYASSSSVYGANTRMPFSVHHETSHPISLYGVSKKTNELMAHCYSHLYGLAVTGLRFFTVYGPWGRPDMSLFIFTRNIIEGKPIDIFNHGSHRRDFTYIDDIVTGVVKIMDKIPGPDPDWTSDNPEPGSSNVPYRLYNIGNNKPVELMYFIELLERNLGKKAIRNFLPMQPGDVPATYADIDALVKAVEFSPVTPVETGVEKFIEWYKKFYKVT